MLNARLVIFLLVTFSFLQVQGGISPFKVAVVDTSKDDYIPGFEELQDNMERENMATINNSTLLTSQQSLVSYFRNPTDLDEEIIVLNSIPNYCELVDFRLHNEGNTFRSSNYNDKTEAERVFIEAGDSGKTAAFVGKYVKDEGTSEIRWITPEQLDRAHDRLSNPFEHQQDWGIWIKAAPHSTFSVEIIFASQIDEVVQLSEVKNTYSSYTSYFVAGDGHAIDGLIESPSYPSSYPNNADIKWEIEIPLRHLHYLKFSLIEFDTEACCDHLTIHEGRTSEGLLIAKFSGQLEDLPSTTFTTASPVVLVDFHSDCAISNGKFALNYTTIIREKLPTCTGVQKLPNDEGYLTSPGYSADYPENSDCSWMIIVSEGMYVNLTVVIFDFNRQDNVSLYSNYLSDRSRIVTLNGSDVGQSFSTRNTNQMQVEMITGNHVEQFRGFYFTYTSYKVKEPCVEGVTIVGETYGEITSPNYPRAYGDNDVCTWTIVASEGNSVQLKITDFDTEKFYDRLYIYDGPDVDSGKEMADLSGYQLSTDVYVTSSNQATVQFVSDFSVDNYRGFQMEVTEYAASSDVCTSSIDNVVGTKGYVKSPGYPNPYPARSNCQYLIEVPQNYVVNIAILDIDINIDDLVILYDGTTTSSRILFSSDHKLNEREVYVNSTTNNVLVTFNSNLLINNVLRGFSLRFQELDIQEMYSSIITLFEPQGEITSPLYPSYYPSGINATWYIQTRFQTQVGLIIKDFELSPSDTLTAYDGNSVNDNQLFQCSGSGPCVVKRSSRNSMLLVFDGKTSNSGFSLNYYAVADECGSSGEIISLAEGYITSPNITGTYPNISCAYEIVVPDVNILPNSPKNIIQIDIQAVISEYCCDILTIYDGGSTNDPVIFVGSGTVSSTTVYTTSNRAFVEWNVDGDNANPNGYDGFSLHFKSVQQKQDNIIGSGSGDGYYECQSVNNLGEVSGMVFSPGYPSPYPNNADVCWFFTYPAQYISMAFFLPRFHTESNYDYLSFYRGLDVAPEYMVEHISGDFFELEIIILAREVTVQFHTDNTITDIGFLMTYNAFL